MLQLLSELLRQVLRTEEYLAIEQVRFSDRLKISFAVDADVRDAAVPGAADRVMTRVTNRRCRSLKAVA